MVVYPSLSIERGHVILVNSLRPNEIYPFCHAILSHHLMEISDIFWYKYIVAYLVSSLSQMGYKFFFFFFFSLPHILQ